MRLILEPEAAFFAALRETDAEIKRILDYGKQIEAEIRNGEDRTQKEHAFHKAISDTVSDHRMITEFLKQRNADGAKNAMKIHIMRAMKELNIE